MQLMAIGLIPTGDRFDSQVSRGSLVYVIGEGKKGGFVAIVVNDDATITGESNVFFHVAIVNVDGGADIQSVPVSRDSNVVGLVLVKRIIKLVVLDDDSIESISPAKAFEDMLPEILARVTERIDRLEIAHSNPVVQGRHLSPPFGA